jgi:hypothetical protein
VDKPPPNPFPGLRPFEFAESYLFFGRDGQSDQLLRKLAENRFAAVVGTSSCGKSSLVRAGLLPALYGGMMAEGGSAWRVAVIRPGVTPVRNLAVALSAPDVFGSTQADDPEIQIILAESTLRRSTLGLVELVRQARMSPHENLLIIVDQFEELFRYMWLYEEEADQAAAFVRLLLEAVQQRELPIYLVLTLRSDFLGDCAQFWNLSETINAGLYLVPRMSRDERREAISGPVAMAGGSISPPLVNRLLNDIGDNPDQLPILQHALMRTWDYSVEHGSDDRALALTQYEYEAIGGMSQALALHADEAFHDLPSERDRQIAETLFKALTEQGADNRVYRRPTRLQEICEIAGTSTAEVVAVVDVFRRDGRSFVMPPVIVALWPDTVIDITHESLIRNWPRLSRWVEDEAHSARMYRRLADNAFLHEEGKSALLIDPGLQLAVEWRNGQRPNSAWARRYHSHFEGGMHQPHFERAMHFLDESEQNRELEQAVKERDRHRMLRRTRLAAITLALMMVISMLLAVYSFKLRIESEARRAEAEKQLREALRLKDEMAIQKTLAEKRMTEAVDRALAEAAKNQSRARKR